MREPGVPPRLDGYDAQRHIGSGGFADVFLYQQRTPNRPVAVKVLTREALGNRVQDFQGEADLMARVRHPYIVQVHDVRVTDDGRPCLIMEFYPGENYYTRTRVRRERFSVPDVLRTGIRLAAAIETAHRAGVLHRDIKPANILTNEYRHPGLTDFGIASGDGRSEAESGVSPPWAPPEAFGDDVLDVRSDVYSLAATLYDLLTGRSPFEVPAGDNSPEALISRIETLPVPSTGLSECPPSLERVLTQAMAKKPEHRPPTAKAFALLLQSVESELQLAPTQLELADTGPAPRDRVASDDADATDIKGVRRIDAQASHDPAASFGLISEVPERPVGSASTMPEREREQPLAPPAVADTQAKVRPKVDESHDAMPNRRISKRVIGGLAVAAVGIVVILAVAFNMGGGDSRDEKEPADPAVNDPFDRGFGDQVIPPPAPGAISSAPTASGFVFSWDQVKGAAQYSVTVDGADKDQLVTDASFKTDAGCIEVKSVGGSGLLSAPTRGCAT